MDWHTVLFIRLRAHSKPEFYRSEPVAHSFQAHPFLFTLSESPIEAVVKVGMKVEHNIGKSRIYLLYLYTSSPIPYNALHFLNSVRREPWKFHGPLLWKHHASMHERP